MPNILQIAVFVDAGYLFATGSKLLVRETVERRDVKLLPEAEDRQTPVVLEKLGEYALKIAPDCRLLRIYWYDGLIGPLPSFSQLRISGSPNAKLRLGSVNARGQQKGVDSLIVADLIELSRSQAISDALILSGDEDIRIGVLLSQTYGVRVHLLGVAPVNGGNQSDSLIQEADTHQEWDRQLLGSIMTVKSTGSAKPPVADDFDAVVDDEIAQFIDEEMSADDIEQAKCATYDVPPKIDRPMLAKLRDKLGRDLTDDERRRYRQRFRARLDDIKS